MKYTLDTQRATPDHVPSISDEPPVATSAVPICEDPLISQMIQIILTAHNMHSDVVALTEALIQQVSQLLPQLASQYPDCYVALEQAINTAPAHQQPQVNAPGAGYTPATEQPRSLAIHFTGREWDILRMMLDGLSNREIADRLVIAASTVKWYVSQLYSKLDVHSRDEAIACARMLFPVKPMLSHTAPKYGRLVGDIAPMVPLSSVPTSAAKGNKDTRPLTF